MKIKAPQTNKTRYTFWYSGTFCYNGDSYLEYQINTKKHTLYSWLSKNEKWTFPLSLVSIGPVVLKKIKLFTDDANDGHKVMTINPSCDPLVQVR